MSQLKGVASHYDAEVAVAEAYGGLGAGAADAGISRESLYRVLSPNGNPTLKTLLAVLKTVAGNVRNRAILKVCRATDQTAFASGGGTSPATTVGGEIVLKRQSGFHAQQCPPVLCSVQHAHHRYAIWVRHVENQNIVEFLHLPFAHAV